MFYLHFFNFLSVIYRWTRNEVFCLLSNSDVAYLECVSTYKAFNFAASPKSEIRQLFKSYDIKGGKNKNTS